MKFENFFFHNLLAKYHQEQRFMGNNLILIAGRNDRAKKIGHTLRRPTEDIAN